MSTNDIKIYIVYIYVKNICMTFQLTLSGKKMKPLHPITQPYMIVHMEPCATQSSILLRSGWALQRHHLRTRFTKICRHKLKQSESEAKTQNASASSNKHESSASELVGRETVGLKWLGGNHYSITWTKTKTGRWFFNKQLTWIEIAREKLPCKHRSCNQQAGNSKSQPQGLASKQKCQTRSCCRLLAS